MGVDNERQPGCTGAVAVHGRGEHRQHRISIAQAEPALQRRHRKPMPHLREPDLLLGHYVAHTLPQSGKSNHGTTQSASTSKSNSKTPAWQGPQGSRPSR